MFKLSATRPVESGRLIQDVTKRVQTTARSQEITLNTALPGDKSLVIGDAQRLAQVLLNLITNALQHTPPGGEVTVGTRKAKGEIHVTVRDSGEGIAPENLPHIFERFYRADRARSRDTGGSGLGLSIAKSLVEAQGGTISVESRVGQGSTFTVSLTQAAIEG